MVVDQPYAGLGSTARAYVSANFVAQAAAAAAEKRDSDFEDFDLGTERRGLYNAKQHMYVLASGTPHADGGGSGGSGDEDEDEDEAPGSAVGSVGSAQKRSLSDDMLCGNGNDGDNYNYNNNYNYNDNDNDNDDGSQCDAAVKQKPGRVFVPDH